MNKKRNIIIGSIICVLLMTVVFFVFNHGKSNEQVVTEYFELLKKKDYKQMYQMLDQKTVYTPTQKYFIEKHKEIYDADTRIGSLYKIGDKNDCIGKILEMDGQKRAVCGSAAYACAHDKFSAERMSREYQQEYLSVFDNKKN